MVGREQQFRGVGPRFVGREPGRIGVPVRADYRQVLDARIELSGDRTYSRLRGKQPVRIEAQRSGHRIFSLVSGVRSPHKPWLRTWAARQRRAERGST